MNIIEEIDVGVPIRVAYNQWTQYDEFPSFMKKVENVDEMDDEDTKINLEGAGLLVAPHVGGDHHRPDPDERIIWKSQGEKGRVDGAVTFHELGPNLTRILVVLEYYPQGLFERTGNLWRAQGRRARLELKHFRRHVMTRTILNPDEVEGWRGIIEDGEVVEDPRRGRRGRAAGAGGAGRRLRGRVRRRGGRRVSEGDESDESEDEYDEESRDRRGRRTGGGRRGGGRG